MSVFDNNGWGFTVGVGLYSYSYYEITFADGTTHSYNTGGFVKGSGVTAKKLNLTFGGWVSKIGCNKCTPESLEGFFADYDLTLLLGGGISSSLDGSTVVGRANLGLGGSFGVSITDKTDKIAEQIQDGTDSLQRDRTPDLGVPVLNERDDDPNSGWPDDNELTGGGSSSSNDNSSSSSSGGSSSSSGGSSSSSGGGSSGGSGGNIHTGGTDSVHDGSSFTGNEDMNGHQTTVPRGHIPPIILDLDGDGIEIMMRDFSGITIDYDCGNIIIANDNRKICKIRRAV